MRYKEAGITTPGQGEARSAHCKYIRLTKGEPKDEDNIKMEDKERVEEASSVLSPRQFTRKTNLFSSCNSS